MTRKIEEGVRDGSALPSLDNLLAAVQRNPDGTVTLRFIESINGAALVSDAALDYMPYSDATYTYYCEAAPGTALATASWRIARKNNATGRIEYADGGAFSNAATNLTTVQGAFA